MCACVWIRAALKSLANEERLRDGGAVAKAAKRQLLGRSTRTLVVAKQASLLRAPFGLLQAGRFDGGSGRDHLSEVATSIGQTCRPISARSAASHLQGDCATWRRCWSPILKGTAVEEERERERVQPAARSSPTN